MATKRATKRRTTRKRSTTRRKRRTTRRKRSTAKRRVTRRRRKTSKKKRVVKRRRKARKVSIRGSKSQVFRGSRQKTKTSGQTKKDLMKNKRGKIVSKKSHKNGLKVYKRNGLAKWTNAFMEARKNLGITGFVACKKGTAFYKEAKKIYEASK